MLEYRRLLKVLESCLLVHTLASTVDSLAVLDGEGFANRTVAGLGDCCLVLRQGTIQGPRPSLSTKCDTLASSALA